MLNVNAHFFALLRYSLGGDIEPILLDGSINWAEVYKEAERQCVLGITYAGVERLSKLDDIPPGQWVVRNENNGKALQVDNRGYVSKKPPLPLLLNWMGEAQKNQKQNNTLNLKIFELIDHLKENGFEGSILKGQGLALLYGPLSTHDNENNLANWRTPGDIDIWIKGDRKDIIRHIRHYTDSEYVVYHNANFPIFPETSVEVHFTPSWFWNPLHNYRLQKFFKENQDSSLSNRVILSAVDAQGKTIEREASIPTVEFNAVFILQHIYRHLFGEGIGLRQVIDYYFVLKFLGKVENEQSQNSHTSTFALLKRLGLGRFTSAMMWILHEALGLEEEYLLCKPDEKQGQFILNEMLRGGNFGHYDDRNKHKTGESALRRYLVHVTRNLRYIHYYPAEIISIPFWKIWHFLWRKQFEK